MTHIEGSCRANCGFCPQARTTKNKGDELSRIKWPSYDFKLFLDKLKQTSAQNLFGRICLQTLNYPENFEDAREIVSEISNLSNLPISVAIPPMPKKQLRDLKNAGVQKIAIALDAITPEIFNRVKGKGVNGPYDWNSHFKCLEKAIEIFSEGFVSTHLIMGLGESHKEFLTIVEKLHNLHVTVSLFPFNPVPHTKLEHKQRPKITEYRKMQLAHFLIVNNKKKIEEFSFNDDGKLIDLNISRNQLRRFVFHGDAFRTSGCSHCNRPYYTSRPSGPIYNYPARMEKSEKEKIFALLINYIK
ncbi:MAG: radical SAM protein [Promethearchaeia archaeon]